MKQAWTLSLIALLATGWSPTPSLAEARGSGIRLITREIPFETGARGSRKQRTASLVPAAVPGAAPHVDRLPLASSGRGETDSTGMGRRVQTPDGRRVAYVAERGTRQFVVVDGTVGKEYDQVHVPLFSPNGKRVAYEAKRGEKWLVVLDGEELGTAYQAIWSPLFSPDSQRVACKARREGKLFVLVDGQERGTARDVALDLVFSADSRHIAYVTRRDSKWVVAVDGAEGKEWDSVSTLAFTPDSRGPVYRAARGDKSFVVLDQEELEIAPSVEAVSADGKRAAYVVRRGEKWRVVLDGKELDATYDAVNSTSFTPGSQQWVLQAGRGGRQFIVVDSQEGNAYDRVDGPVFSPDGKRMAYRAWQGTTCRVVVDGKEGTEYDQVGPLLFSPDSRRLACQASRAGKQFVVVDGAEGRGYHALYAGGMLRFSPDSRRLAYVASRGAGFGWRVVVDAQEGKEFSEVSAPVFSPDSRRVAYVAATSKSSYSLGRAVLGLLAFPLVAGMPGGAEAALDAGWATNCRWRVVVDEEETGEYGLPRPDGPVFDGSNHLHVDARRGNKITRVQVEIAQE